MAKQATTLKTLLKAADPIEIPMHPEFYDKLHMRIMTEVIKTEIKPTPGRLRSAPGKLWREIVSFKK